MTKKLTPNQMAMCEKLNAVIEAMREMEAEWSRQGHHEAGEYMVPEGVEFPWPMSFDEFCAEVEEYRDRIFGTDRS